ncbi:MAG: LuxR C-terminal-related transcriptional regulator [Synergistaceae bacterium]|nr:LuxR C-terminal-related transcriptional regulator [Synergistaceae bacterium]
MTQTPDSLSGSRFAIYVLRTGALYGAHILIMCLSAMIIARRTIAVIGAEYVIPMQSFIYLMTVVGFFLYHRLSYLGQTCTEKRKLFGCFILLFALSIAVVTVTGNIFAFIAASAVAAVVCGYVADGIHYHNAIFVDGSKHVGVITSGALCCAVAIQGALHYHASLTVIVCALVAAYATLIAVFAGPAPRDMLYDIAGPEDYSSLLKSHNGYVVLGILVTISIIIGMYVSIAIGMALSSAVAIDGRRLYLFFLAGLLLAGLLADIRNRSYVEYSALGALLVCIMAAVCLAVPQYVQEALMLISFISGFYLAFLTVTFTDLTLKTQRPTLWAGMGHVIYLVSAALVSVPLTDVFKRFGIQFTALTITVMACLTIIMFFMKKESASEGESRSVSTDEYIPVFSEFHGLTDKETQILKNVLRTDRRNVELAEEMGISERVFQRHLAEIYEKTNTSSRISLCIMFYEERLKA